MPQAPNYRRTPQREAILSHVISRRSHLSAEEIHAALRRRHPRLSMGTVYRNLHILVAQGKLRVLRFGSGQDLYDARLEPHYHLVCRSCGDLRDSTLPPVTELDKLASHQATDFSVEGHMLAFHGLCRNCSAQTYGREARR